MARVSTCWSVIIWMTQWPKNEKPQRLGFTAPPEEENAVPEI